MAQRSITTTTRWVSLLPPWQRPMANHRAQWWGRFTRYRHFRGTPQGVSHLLRKSSASPGVIVAKHNEPIYIKQIPGDAASLDTFLNRLRGMAPGGNHPGTAAGGMRYNRWRSPGPCCVFDPLSHLHQAGSPPVSSPAPPPYPGGAVADGGVDPAIAARPLPP